MHEPHQHVSPIKNWKQLVVVVALAFIVPIAVIILLSQYVTDAPVAPSENDSAVLNRIKPVGEVLLASRLQARRQTLPAPRRRRFAPPLRRRRSGACRACGCSGRQSRMARRPTTRRARSATAPASPARPSSATRRRGRRASRPASTRCTRARSRARRAMPAKGGNASLSDADVKAAVDYMVAAAQVTPNSRTEPQSRESRRTPRGPDIVDRDVQRNVRDPAILSRRRRPAPCASASASASPRSTSRTSASCDR